MKQENIENIYYAIAVLETINKDTEFNSINKAIDKLKTVLDTESREEN